MGSIGERGSRWGWRVVMAREGGGTRCGWLARIDTFNKILFKPRLPKSVNTSTSRVDRSPGNPTPDKIHPHPSKHAGSQGLSRGPASALGRTRGGNPGLTVPAVSFLLRNQLRGQDAAAPSQTLQGREAPVPGLVHSRRFLL